MVEQIRQILMKSSSLNHTNETNHFIQNEQESLFSNSTNYSSFKQSQSIYPTSNNNIYSSLPNSAAADAAAAIFQAYSLFNRGTNNNS
jgi:hypothetical protein